MHIEGRDDKDNEILDIIKDNARLTYTEIGEKAGISRVAVKNRIEQMEADGVIKGYKTIIEPISAPGGIEFIIDVAAEPEYFNEVSDDLAKEKLIRRLVIATGRTRLLAFGYAANYQTLESYVGQLYHRMRGIRDITFQNVTSVLKDVDRGVEYEKRNRS